MTPGIASHGFTMGLDLLQSLSSIRVRPVLLLLTTYFISTVTTLSQQMSDGEQLKKDYHGYKVFTLYPMTPAQTDFVEHLWLNDSTMKLDFWKPPSKLRKTVDVMVAPGSLELFDKAMKLHNITTNVMMEDVALAIAKEQEVIKFNTAFLRDDRSKAGKRFRLDRYHSYGEIQEWLHRLSRKYPHVVQLIQLQNESNRQTALTHEGRTIDMVKLGYAKPDGGRKPAFWIDGGIHAREWAAPSVVLYIINQLLKGKDIDRKIDQYLAEVDWYLLPVVNPDGYEYSRNFDRMWRKNRNPNTHPRRRDCWGVDLNRNFDWNWGGKGSSSDPCKETYHGDKAFSEVESTAIQYQVRRIRASLQGFVTLHAYSQIWMYPYGHDYNKRPRDWKDLLRVARKAAHTLKSYYGKSFTVDTGANALYPASGGSDDWAKGKMNVKYVYLVELRPEDEADVPARRRQSHFGFLLPESQIVPMCEETWGGIQVVADAILKRNSVFPYTANENSPQGISGRHRESPVREQIAARILGHLVTPSENPGEPPPTPVDSSPLAQPDSSCSDSTDSCDWWGSKGACKTYPIDMARYCPYTCNLC